MWPCHPWPSRAPQGKKAEIHVSLDHSQFWRLGGLNSERRLLLASLCSGTSSAMMLGSLDVAMGLEVILIVANIFELFPPKSHVAIVVLWNVLTSFDRVQNWLSRSKSKGSERNLWTSSGRGKDQTSRSKVDMTMQSTLNGGVGLLLRRWANGQIWVGRGSEERQLWGMKRGKRRGKKTQGIKTRPQSSVRSRCLNVKLNYWSWNAVHFQLHAETQEHQKNLWDK